MEMLDAGLALLDREILDAEDQRVGKVDDLALSDAGSGEPPRIEALLMGPAAYGTRLGGPLGDWIRRAGAKLADTEDPITIPMALVAEIDVSVKLSITVDQLPRALRAEGWLRDHLIGRIPGAHRAPE